MAMIDTRDWEFFDFPKVFRMENGFYNKKPESSKVGTIPFIGATDKNNGVTDYFTLEEIESASKTGEEPNQEIDVKLFAPHALCVTNNGSVGYAYYQDKPFTCSHDVNPLYRIDGDFNEFTALFVATVIMHDRYRWGYGRKWRPKRMKNSKLKLPIQKDANGRPIIDANKKFSGSGFLPDWEFMETFIKTLNYKLPETKQTVHDNISSANWIPFTFEELDIEIYKAKAHAKVDMDFSKSRQLGRLPFVSRTELNNSVDGWVFKDEESGIEEGNALVVGDTTSTISYQPNPFVAGDHIVVIRAEWLNKYTGLFIQTLLNKERYRYSYGRAFKMDLIKTTKLLLPVDINKEVDWKWIEEYIKSLPFAENV